MVNGKCIRFGDPNMTIKPTWAQEIILCSIVVARSETKLLLATKAAKNGHVPICMRILKEKSPRRKSPRSKSPEGNLLEGNLLEGNHQKGLQGGS